MRRIEQILQAAIERRASDTHFSSGESVWMRVDGDLVRADETVYSHEELEQLIFEILSEEELAKLTKNKNLDKSHYVEGVGNFRVNVFYARRGIGSVIRSLPSKMPSMEDLGLPAVIQSLANLPKGLILVTGPTGSGKSTTLAAIIDYMNTNFSYHILTVEDPVEFIHQSKRSLVNQREIGQSCPTFADALKYALREDPDVILVGELRDIETMSLAMTAAETGHLVLGTLHTRGAASTMDRIIESFPSTQQAQARAMLSESLQGVISQALLKRPGGKGRVAVYEIMVMNYAISNLVREGKTFQVPSIMQTGRKEGMLLMEAHAKELLADGLVDEEEAEALIASLSRGHGQKQGSGAAEPAAPKGPPQTLGVKAAAKPAAPPPPVPARAAAPAPAPAPAPAAARPQAAAPALPTAAAKPVAPAAPTIRPPVAKPPAPAMPAAPAKPPAAAAPPVAPAPLRAVPTPPPPASVPAPVAPVTAADEIPLLTPEEMATAPVDAPMPPQMSEYDNLETDDTGFTNIDQLEIGLPEVPAPAPVPEVATPVAKPPVPAAAPVPPAPVAKGGLPPPPRAPGPVKPPEAKSPPKPLPLPVKKTG